MAKNRLRLDFVIVNMEPNPLNYFFYIYIYMESIKKKVVKLSFVYF